MHSRTARGYPSPHAAQSLVFVHFLDGIICGLIAKKGGALYIWIIAGTREWTARVRELKHDRITPELLEEHLRGWIGCMDGIIEYFSD